MGVRQKSALLVRGRPFTIERFSAWCCAFGAIGIILQKARGCVPFVLFWRCFGMGQCHTINNLFVNCHHNFSIYAYRKPQTLRFDSQYAVGANTLENEFVGI